MLCGGHVLSLILIIVVCFLMCQGCRSQRVKPRIDSSAYCWRAIVDIPGWKLCTLRVCTKNPSSKEKEASLQEEDEEGETEARCLCTRRVET